MSNTVFTNKKVQLKQSGWGKKSVIGGIVVALLAGFGFGIYRTANDDESSQRSTRTSRIHHQQSSNLPVFASQSPTTHKRQSLALGTKKSKRSSHKHVAGHGKKHSKKHASRHGKHHSKLASKKSHAKLKLAKHKKKHSHHVAKNKKSKRHSKHLAAK